MNKVDLDSVQAVHCIGIGGIGISAIARMLLVKGVVVTGSDRDASKITDELIKAGAHITIGQADSHVPPVCECVIYTVAIPDDNAELIEAKKRGIPLMTYPQTLEAISRSKYTIAISGTHGKTTTTAMVASILREASLDPTVIVGSLMKGGDGIESNFIAGASKYFVVEADEYRKSFHNLYPKILVINNLDEDHLDFYKDLKDIQDSFRELAMRVPKDGFIVCNPKDPHVAPVISGLVCTIIDYTKIVVEKSLKVPGEHNRSNAKAAIAVVMALGVDQMVAEEVLSKFEGVWRRFEYKGKTKNGAQVYDDYAHNPQKVQALLSGAREHMGKEKRIVALFQPHLFSRTKALLEGFAKAFKDADEVILVPIFPAREPFDATISSDILAERIRVHHEQVTSFPSFDDATKYLAKTLGPRDMLITIGAGEGYKIGEALLSEKA